MQKIIVLDTETTGLNNPHALEVAASLCEFQDRKLVPVAKFHQLFNPNKAIEPAASEINGYTNDMLADKPDIQDFQLRELGITPADTVYIIGQYIKFDIECLKNTATGELAKILETAIPICTKKLASNHYDLPNNRLVYIATDVLGMDEEIVKTNAHGAEFDVQICLDFVNHILSLLDIQSIESLERAARRIDFQQYEFLKPLDCLLPRDQEAFDVLIIKANQMGLPHVSHCRELAHQMTEALEENAFNFADEENVESMGELPTLKAYLHDEKAFNIHSPNLGLKPELINDGFKAFKERLDEHIVAGGAYKDVFIDDEHIERFVLYIKRKIRYSNWMVCNILQNYVDFCFSWFDYQNYKTV